MCLLVRNTYQQISNDQCILTLCMYTLQFISQYLTRQEYNSSKIGFPNQLKIDVNVRRNHLEKQIVDEKLNFVFTRKSLN